MNDMTNGERPDGVRLQKVLAQAGVASRRAAEELIAAGRVSVDGKVVREMGRRVDPETAVVHVDGSRIVLRDDLVHLALNKPRGILSTMSDDRGRPCVGDLVVERGIVEENFTGSPRARLFHVGRLDADTEGLLLLTNDGDLGPPADAPVVRDREDLPRRGARPGAARPRAAAARRRRAGRRPGARCTRSSWSTRTPGGRWSSW